MDNYSNQFLGNPWKTEHFLMERHLQRGSCPCWIRATWTSQQNRQSNQQKWDLYWEKLPLSWENGIQPENIGFNPTWGLEPIKASTNCFTHPPNMVVGPVTLGYISHCHDWQFVCAFFPKLKNGMGNYMLTMLIIYCNWSFVPVSSTVFPFVPDKNIH